MLVVLLALPVFVFGVASPASAVSCAGTPVAKQKVKTFNIVYNAVVPDRPIVYATTVKVVFKYDECSGNPDKVRARRITWSFQNYQPNETVPSMMQNVTGGLAGYLYWDVPGDASAELNLEVLNNTVENMTLDTGLVTKPWVLQTANSSGYFGGWFRFGSPTPPVYGELNIKGQTFSLVNFIP